VQGRERLTEQEIETLSFQYLELMLFPFSFLSTNPARELMHRRIEQCGGGG